MSNDQITRGKIVRRLTGDNFPYKLQYHLDSENFSNPTPKGMEDKILESIIVEYYTNNNTQIKSQIEHLFLLITHRHMAKTSEEVNRCSL